jgi:DNA repair exonuclease SbcCD nuclease subunit
MQILHISDLHLDKDSQKETIKYILNPLIERAKKIHLHKPIDLIILSGDLLNEGGRSFENDPELGFLVFEEIFISPLLNALNLERNQFFMVPGNHDVNRNLDSQLTELGIDNILSNEQELSKFYKQAIDGKTSEGISRIKPFKNFEKSYYSNIQIPKSISTFGSAYIVDINGMKIGIAGINSSWRCYNSDTDKGRLIIGENQIQDLIDFIKETDLKIAITHHDTDHLKSFDRLTIEARLQKEFDLWFLGHVHTPNSEYKLHSLGKVFKSICSGSLTYNKNSENDRFRNGFTVVDYDKIEGQIVSSFYKYEYQKSEYVPNNSLGDDMGVWTVPITKPLSSTEKNNYEDKNPAFIHETILNILTQKLNDSLSYYNTQPIIWVDPIISRTNEISQNADDNYNNKVSIDSIIDNPTSTFIKAPPQFGLTSLARYLVVEA